MKTQRTAETKKWMAALLAAGGLWTAEAAQVRVDFAAECGAVKPVNAVGQPPMVGAPRHFGMLHYLKEAGIPYSRLHDVGGLYGGFVYVDIPNVFRDFDADENDPKNYDFAHTDRLMCALAENGVEPFYRLGVTIENYPEVARYRIDPPKDYAKWARICEHVIAHYTAGWANGYHQKVTHWEIWNEPEINPNQEISMMWHAPFAEYLRLYEVASKHLKRKFPHLKIGGLAGCGFYVATMRPPAPLKAGASEAEKKEYARRKLEWEQKVYHDTCARAFLALVRDRKCPLDFFSFHSYSRVEHIIEQIAYAQKLLEEFGLGKTEMWLDEWLPGPRHEKLGTARQASEIAAVLCGMQASPLYGSCLYDARCGLGAYSPLFNPLTYKPHKAYYVYTAFNELRKCGTAVKSATDGTKGFWAAAAKGANGAAVLLANCTKEAMPLACDFGGRAVAGCRLTDETRTDAPVSLPTSLPPYSFCIILLK